MSPTRGGDFWCLFAFHYVYTVDGQSRELAYLLAKFILSSVASINFISIDWKDMFTNETIEINVFVDSDDSSDC